MLPLGVEKQREIIVVGKASCVVIRPQQAFQTSLLYIRGIWRSPTSVIWPFGLIYTFWTIRNKLVTWETISSLAPNIIYKLLSIVAGGNPWGSENNKDIISLSWQVVGVVEPVQVRYSWPWLCAYLNYFVFGFLVKLLPQQWLYLGSLCCAPATTPQCYFLGFDVLFDNNNSVIIIMIAWLSNERTCILVFVATLVAPRVLGLTPIVSGFEQAWAKNCNKRTVGLLLHSK